MNTTPAIIPEIEAAAISRHHKSGFTLGPLTFKTSRPLTVIAGPNGVGKTTLLRMLSTVDRPDSGQLAWHGGDKRGARRLGIGWSPDSGAEAGGLTVWQTVLFWARQSIFEPAAARQKTELMLRALSLSERSEEFVAAQSFGNRRRLNLACALVHEPRFAFLDEPTAGLDAQGIEQLRSLLRERAASGLTTVIGSNDTAFIASLGADIIDLSDATRIQPSDANVAEERARPADSLSRYRSSVPTRRPGRLGRIEVNSLFTREMVLTLRSGRALAIKMVAPLLLALPLVLGGAPSFWAATLLSVLVAMIGCVGTAIGFAHARESNLLSRLALTPKSAARHLLSWISATVIIDLLQLAPVMLLITIAYQDAVPIAVSLFLATLAGLIVAATVGTIVSLATASIGDILIDAIVLLAPILYFAGLFTGIPRSGWQAVVSKLDPFTYTHDALVRSLHGLPLIPLPAALAAPLLAIIICAALLSILARRVLR